MKNEEKVLYALCGLYDGETSQAIVSDLLTYVRRNINNMVSEKDALESSFTLENAAGHHLDYLVNAGWKALDGTGRLINCAFFPEYPESNLVPPTEISSQCTFYTVRRDLHQHPDAEDGAMVRLMWGETRDPGTPWYERLSLYYHISRFMPLKLRPDGQLPGWQDIPRHVQILIEPQSASAMDRQEGTERMLNWEKRFIEECFDLIVRHADQSSRS
jgi:hypothetical protein